MTTTSFRSKSNRANYDDHENIAHAPLEELKAKAKAEGIWSLSLPVEDGGLGYNVVEIASCLRGNEPFDFRAGLLQCLCPG